MRISWDGIVVEDEDNLDDVIRRVREVLEVAWSDDASAFEQAACDAFGVGSLRSYFRKPGKGGFWEDHIRRYSVKRSRKAPVYWLLQSSKKHYGMWLYYHRLDKDLLFKALVNYVEPKIRLEISRLETKQYKERRQANAVLAMCVSEASETYHHWRVFTHGADGVCIQFHRDGLLAAFKAIDPASRG